ncbi:Alpha-1,2-mannosidase [Fulvivirga imtechensis AK7]|uniref:Alpha-1,2-mannosidase n=1 Tax=Fulvivirga imtechensis AK7 TaxID=1237149 RepID=L8JY58_9BACT|nr:GH92 family glycosyl hydrolase [Fulvivirga imtechensis]ELR72142.1 Alpha-1,2-mannosidase [Fulvivirga imtechensis AK7]
MKRKTIIWTSLAASLVWSCSGQENTEPDYTFEPASYVDPFIGTGGKGKTYPGATVPFGMVQLSPDNGRNGWDWISGYFYPDSVIAGFSHTHLSGTGIGDLYDISYMPVTYLLPVERSESLAKEVGSEYYSLFSHANETAAPGYYQVYLNDYKINVELTATERTGLQKYTVDDRDSLQIILNLGYARNWDSTVEASAEIQGDSMIVGYRKSIGWAPDQRVYFASIFSEPFDAYQLLAKDSLIADTSVKGSEVQVILTYPSAKNKSVTIKTGISSVSIENALLNLEAESLNKSFEEVKEQAATCWDNELGKIEVVSKDEGKKTSFYTALYQSMLAPTLFSDVNGEYKGANGNICTTADYERYTTFSLWDTFRAQHPLLTILQPSRVDDFVNSMLSHYDEYGYLPVWDLAGNETNMMIGYHAVPVIADAYLKGFRGFDIDKAYQGMIKSAEAEHFGLKDYMKYGYVPASDNESVSLTLEYAYDDWCIAQMAKALGKQADYEIYSKRALSYVNLFDKSSGFMRAKDSLGNWRKSFSPMLYNSGDYTEANAWHYTWFVPHHPEKLVELMGGKKATREKLDSLFTVPQATDTVPEWISGYIGQYVHGNEPCHHIPYLYNYTDQPWRTQERVRQIANELYQPEPAGICGNEDCGQMSAWYVFSAMGFYPLNPVGGQYAIGVPLFEEAVIELPGNKAFKIKAQGLSEKNTYIQHVSINGKPLKNLQISHKQIMEGGELVFKMGPKPFNLVQ